MVQTTSILLAIIIMLILLAAVLIILSGTVPAFNEAMSNAVKLVFPSAKSGTNVV